MNTRTVNTTALCQAFEQGLILLDVDSDDAFVLADKVYSQFAAKTIGAMGEIIPETLPAGDTVYTLEQAVSALRQLEQIVDCSMEADIRKFRLRFESEIATTENHYPLNVAA